jgi:hypothetical protein
MTPMGRAFGLLLCASSVAHAAPAGLREAEVRAFVGRQSQAWNAGQLAAYFGLFTADATFTEQGRARDGRVVPYGTSTLAEARAQARRSLVAARVHETTAIQAIEIAPDGRSARITAGEDTTLAAAGRTRRICAERVQTVVATPAGLRSKGQTDTVVRCR